MHISIIKNAYLCCPFYREEIERVQAKDKSIKEHKAAINIIIKE